MSSSPDAAYAAEVARLLWPEPWDAPHVTRSGPARRPHHRDAYLFPSSRRPRLLVPTDVTDSAVMLQRLWGGRAVTRPARAILERSARHRAFGLTRWPVLRMTAPDPAPESIETHLAELFGTEVRVGIRLGTRRANQKPVLQVFSLDGQLRGYAKVGHNALTADLVRREARSLRAVRRHGPASFEIPQVLDLRTWRGLEVLVISALAASGRAQVSDEQRTAAMHELARLAGVTQARLTESRFWTRLRADVRELADRPDGGRLVVAMTAVERLHGAQSVAFGAWHGDWGHWNMAVDQGVLQVWDWERYDEAVPLGFDGLHHLAERVRPGHREAGRQQVEFLRSVPAALSALGVPADHHDLTLTLYLLEIAVRYVDALRFGASPALRLRTAWVLSELAARTGPLHLDAVKETS